MVSKETETEYMDTAFADEDALQKESKEALEQQLNVSDPPSSKILCLEELPADIQYQAVQKDEESHGETLGKHDRYEGC